MAVLEAVVFDGVVLDCMRFSNTSLTQLRQRCIHSSCTDVGLNAGMRRVSNIRFKYYIKTIILFIIKNILPLL